MTRRESTEKRHKRIRSKVRPARPPAGPAAEVARRPPFCRTLVEHWAARWPDGSRQLQPSDAPRCLLASLSPLPQVEGTTERPRLAVFRSNNHIYAQVCTAVAGHRWWQQQQQRW